MENKLKILIVHNYYKIPGGEDSVVLNEKNLLEKNGHKVILYSRNNSEIKNFSFIRKLFLPFTAIYSFKTSREIKKIIKKEQIDIVHVHNTLSLVSPSVFYAAKKMKVPVVQTIHNFRMICPAATLYRDEHICEDCIKKGLKCAVKYKCYRNSKLQAMANVAILRVNRFFGIYKKINYICLTEFNKNKLLSYKKISKNQIFVKPNFVGTDVSFIPYNQRDNQIIYVGRLDKLKGIEILFNAWLKINNDVNLVVCGSGPLEQWCTEFIENNKISNIKMLGFIDNEKAKKLIANSKALILPTQWYEGFPVTIVEAFSVGTPVLGSDIGNVGNLIKEGITGWKFKPDNADDLISAVNGMTDITSTVLKEFNNNYTAQRNYDKLLEIYNKLVL